MPDQPIALGRRIVVYGVTGSGKTTVARRLGALLGLPVIELDALFWNPNWVDTPADEFRTRVQSAFDAAPAGWVCDGNYTGRLGDFAVSQADSVVWMHLPLWVTFRRVLTRTVSRALRREVLWGTNQESWRLSFLDRNSILLWSLTHHWATARNIKTVLSETDARPRVYELKSARDVGKFLATVRSMEAASS